MKCKFAFLLISILVNVLLSCGQNPDKRKVKLYNEIVATRQDQQLTMTIQLEPRERRSIAVMFFQNQTDDQNLQWLQKGLTEMFIHPCFGLNRINEWNFISRFRIKLERSNIIKNSFLLIVSIDKQ